MNANSVNPNRSAVRPPNGRSRRSPRSAGTAVPMPMGRRIWMPRRSSRNHLHAARVLSRNSGAPALVAGHIAKLTHHLEHIAGDLGFAIVPLFPAPVAQIQTEADWPVQPKEA